MSATTATFIPDEGRTFSPWLVAVAVSLAAFMEVLDTTIVNVSLNHIAGSLGASADESTWVLTSYLVANGIVLPLSGWLADVLGRKRYFLGCIAAFTLSSFACGIAMSLPMLIVFRLLQGIAGGGLQPTQQAIIVDAFPKEKLGVAFGVTGLTMIAAPILGPALGGYITDSFSWRWIFYLNVPVGLFALWVVNLVVTDPDHAKPKGAKKIDYIGLGLVILGIGALQMMLDKGQQDDWFDSRYITTLALVALAALSCGVVWLLHQKDPIIELRLLGQIGFGLSSLLIFCVGVALYASSVLLPILTQSQFGYDATMAGLVLSPGGLAVVFLMPLAGKLSDRLQARYLVVIGFVLVGIGMAATSYVSPETDYKTFVMMRILQVLGLPFLFIPTSALAFKDVPKELSNKASALFSLARNIGGSIGIAVVVSYVSRHQQMQQTALAHGLSAGDANYRALVGETARALVGHGYTALTAHQAAVGRVYEELLHQSALLSYNDGFRMMAVIMAVMAVLAFLLPRNDPHVKKTVAAH